MAFEPDNDLCVISRLRREPLLVRGRMAAMRKVETLLAVGHSVFVDNDHVREFVEGQRTNFEWTVDGWGSLSVVKEIP